MGARFLKDLFEVCLVQVVTFRSVFQAHFVLDIEASISTISDGNIREPGISHLWPCLEPVLATPHFLIVSLL